MSDDVNVLLARRDPEEEMQLQRDLGRLEGRLEGINTATIQNTKDIASLKERLGWMLGVYSVVAGAVGFAATLAARKLGVG